MVSHVRPMLACYNRFMQPTKELIEQLEREDVEQARQMTPSQKRRAGGDLAGRNPTSVPWD